MLKVNSLVSLESYKPCNFFCKITNSIGEAGLSDNETLFKRLVLSAQMGNRDAYSGLLLELRSFLKNYLRKRIFDQAEVDEVIQEILLATHKSLHTYDPDKSFMGWFLAITEYKVIDYIRGYKKRMTTIDFDSISNLVEMSNSNSDLKIDIERAINSLSSREKEILTLIKFEGQSVSDIAKRLNLTEANVKVIVHRAYINIKSYLGIRP